MRDDDMGSQGAGGMRREPPLLEPLKEIRTLHDRPREQRAQFEQRRWERIEHLGAQACSAFAGVNGWRVARRAFSFHCLITGKAHHYCLECSRDPLHRAVPFDLHLDDHPEYFRAPTRPYRPTAIAAHLYAGDATVDGARAWAREHRLVLHEPANSEASWYNPGHTRLVVYTRPGASVDWPLFAK